MNGPVTKQAMLSKQLAVIRRDYDHAVSFIGPRSPGVEQATHVEIDHRDLLVVEIHDMIELGTIHLSRAKVALVVRRSEVVAVRKLELVTIEIG